jgi:hypothetical protein
MHKVRTSFAVARTTGTVYLMVSSSINVVQKSKLLRRNDGDAVVLRLKLSATYSLIEDLPFIE